MKVFVSWSGGKDSALACYNAMKSGRVEVAYLLNMLSEDGIHSRSHNLTAGMLKAQAAAMGVAMVQRSAQWQKYEEGFKAALLKFKEEGLQSGVFGDIDLQVHRDWVEKVCSDTGLRALLPLWQRTRDALMEEFISAGFKAIIVVTNREFMGEEWLGRTIDKEFVRDLKAKGGVDLCGEKGEYHSFVYDGPIFKKPVDFVMGKKIMKDKHWFLDVLPDLQGVDLVKEKR